MKNLKIALLMIASFSSLQICAMEREKPRFIRVNRNTENVIIAEDSDGRIYNLYYNPVNGTYTGDRGTRVVYVPGKIPQSNARVFLEPEMAEELYKELSRIEKG